MTKTLFYGCMVYVAIGLCGAIGAILEILILLWWSVLFPGALDAGSDR